MSVENLTNEIKKRHSEINGSVFSLEQKIEDIDIPTKLSELSDDSTHRVVTDTEKTTWNNKSNFSGKFTDLSNKPTTLSGYGITDAALKSAIPTKTSQLTNNSGYLTSIPSSYITETELNNILNSKSETWTFTLDNGDVVTKKVVLL